LPRASNSRGTSPEVRSRPFAFFIGTMPSKGSMAAIARDLGKSRADGLLGPVGTGFGRRRPVDSGAPPQPQGVAHRLHGFGAESVGPYPCDPRVLLFEAEHHLERLDTPACHQPDDDGLAVN